MVAGDLNHPPHLSLDTSAGLVRVLVFFHGVVGRKPGRCGQGGWSVPLPGHRSTGGGIPGAHQRRHPAGLLVQPVCVCVCVITSSYLRSKLRRCDSDPCSNLQCGKVPISHASESLETLEMLYA